MVFTCTENVFVICVHKTYGVIFVDEELVMVIFKMIGEQVIVKLPLSSNPSVKDQTWIFGPMNMVVLIHKDTHGILFLADLKVLVQSMTVLQAMVSIFLDDDSFPAMVGRDQLHHLQRFEIIRWLQFLEFKHIIITLFEEHEVFVSDAQDHEGRVSWRNSKVVVHNELLATCIIAMESCDPLSLVK